MKSTTALRTIRRQATELRDKDKIIDAALDDAWCKHISVFKMVGSPSISEEKFKRALLKKWIAAATKKPS